MSTSKGLDQLPAAIRSGSLLRNIYTFSHSYSSSIGVSARILPLIEQGPPSRPCTTHSVVKPEVFTDLESQPGAWDQIAKRHARAPVRCRQHLPAHREQMASALLSEIAAESAYRIVISDQKSGRRAAHSVWLHHDWNEVRPPAFRSWRYMAEGVYWPKKTGDKWKFQLFHLQPNLDSTAGRSLRARQRSREFSR